MSTKPAARGVPFAFTVDEPDSPPISNSAFLDSYIQLGVWIRLVHVYEQISIIESTDEPMRRLAAVASVFSAFGALTEDVSATFLAWIAWNRCHDLRLADALYNIVLTEDIKARPSVAYVDNVVGALIAGKRARIDAQVFARSLLAHGGVAALQLLGLPWKKVPSVKVAKGEELRFWERLPKTLEEVLTVLSSDASRSVRFSYNKIKHGPQLVVDDLSSFNRRLGVDAAIIAAIEASLQARRMTPATLRILFKGATTSRTATEPGPPTLWIDDDTSSIRRLLACEYYNLGKLPWLLGTWLRKLRFNGSWSELPPVVMRLDGDVTRWRAVGCSGM
jgi:hypothetical protein